MSAVPEVRRAERGALWRYVLATGIVLLAVIGVTTAGAWRFANSEARQEAKDIAQTFAETVAAPLRVADLHADGEGGSRELLATAVAALLEGDDVYRVKVWVLVGDHIEIAYSDVPSIDGLRVPVSAVLAEALRTMEPAVVPVPADAAHATELASGHELLEAYVPFRDASGELAVAELYLITQVDERAGELLRHVLPLVLGGPMLLAAATLPLALRLARSHGRAERDRRELVDRALAVSEAERRRLAARLHDGVIQNLAAIGMALELDGTGGATGDPARRELLAERVRSEAQQLRGLLDELDPPAVTEGDLRVALATLVPPGASKPEVTIVGASLDRLVGDRRGLVHRVAIELMRNALAHAQASAVEVELLDRGGQVGVVVRDDGIGFDPAAAPPGHHGLRLVRAAVAEVSGTLTIRSGEGSASTAVEALIPAS